MEEQRCHPCVLEHMTGTDRTWPTLCLALYPAAGDNEKLKKLAAVTTFADIFETGALAGSCVGYHLLRPQPDM